MLRARQLNFDCFTKSFDLAKQWFKNKKHWHYCSHVIFNANHTTLIELEGEDGCFTKDWSFFFCSSCNGRTRWIASCIAWCLTNIRCRWHVCTCMCCTWINLNKKNGSNYLHKCLPASDIEHVEQRMILSKRALRDLAKKIWWIEISMVLVLAHHEFPPISSFQTFSTWNESWDVNVSLCALKSTKKIVETASINVLPNLWFMPVSLVQTGFALAVTSSKKLRAPMQNSSERHSKCSLKFF